MRVNNNLHKQSVTSVHYGAAIRRKGDEASLFIVTDLFTGDDCVRIVNLENGKLLKIPKDEEVTIVSNAYIEVENNNGFI